MPMRQSAVSLRQAAYATIAFALLVVRGVAIFLYVFGLVIELTVRGTVIGAWQERRIRRRVERLEEHYVVCGYGRMGRSVADGDVLIGVGTPSEIQAREELFQTREFVAG